MKIKYHCFAGILLILFMQCSRKKEEPVSEAEIRQTTEALVGANRLLVQKDKKKIQEYIQQHNLTLTETASGLWYGITHQGTGAKVKEKDLVTLRYQVFLLDGTKCYDSDSLGVKQFRVGQGGVESGLEEGVLFLNKGSRALFVMPPHLAHGLTGDGNRIPSRSIIVYQVELVKIEQ